MITKGNEVLLARSSRFPPGLYPTVAGFIEAGESAEEAVHREVFEEVGVKVGQLEYLKSQSWPFPHSLMLGFHAVWESGEINIDEDEIEAANWFKLDELPAIPFKGTISRYLIDQYLSKEKHAS